MAKVFGLLNTFLNIVPPDQVDPNVLGGRVRVMYEEYTVVTATAENDELVLGFLPAGSRYLGGGLSLSATLGASTTVDVGSRDEADNSANDDDDRFAAALDGTSTAWLWYNEDLPAAVGYSPTNRQEVYLSFEGADPAAAVVVRSLIFYVDRS
jgi:hypothetical protein